MKTTRKTTHKDLPKGINATDIKEPSWRTHRKVMADARELGLDSVYAQFDIWYSESFGWCIPTLLITRSRRANQSYSGGERTYAVRIDTGSTVRIGNGPHIKARHTVYIRKTRVAALQKFIALIASGGAKANEIRDSISTRRAQTAARRASWGW